MSKTTAEERAEIRWRAVDATYVGGDTQQVADDVLTLLVEVEALERERDRYAAVIEKADHRVLNLRTSDADSVPLAIDLHTILASVDSGSALAERDAEKWREGTIALHQTVGEYMPGTKPPVNPYHAEQIRKEGKSNEH